MQLLRKFVVALASSVTWSSFVSAWNTPSIQFDRGLVPNIDCELPILSLGPPASIPQDLLRQFVAAAAPNATLMTDPETGGQSAYNGDQLVAFVDPASGETRVFPNLETVQPAEGSINVGAASQYIRDNRTFPVDDTIVSVVGSSNLLGSTVHNDGGSSRRSNTDPSDPQLYLSYAVVQRNISSGGKNYRVCGPGSKASFGFASDGGVHSLSYLWQPATLTKQVAKARNVDIIFDSIVKELGCISKGSSVRVDGVDVCFYDSGSNFIQPVYRFWATLHPESSGNASSAAPDHILGYLPIGDNSPETIPNLSNSDHQLTQPTQPQPLNEGREEKRWGKPNIKVGRYVVRNASVDESTPFVANANHFMSGLQNPPLPTTPVANFINSQFFWAYPFLFTDQKNQYINRVDIAEIEVHGNYHLFTTLSNFGDVVRLSDIPADGYGGGGGSCLSYWIIHSCEVIPTPTDYSAADRHLAFDDWWHIFNGIHAVLGACTELWIIDGTQEVFGRAISGGAPVLSSWMHTIHDAAAYNPPTFYPDGNRGIDEPLGRASAVVVCGHAGDTVLQRDNLGRAHCLREFWYEN